MAELIKYTITASYPAKEFRIYRGAQDGNFDFSRDALIVWRRPIEASDTDDIPKDVLERYRAYARTRFVSQSVDRKIES